MSDLAAALLALMIRETPPAPPKGVPAESVEDRAERLVNNAVAIDVASGGDPDVAAVQYVIWKAESQFARWIHDGTIKGDHGRAACQGSIHPSAKVLDWRLLVGVGLEPTIRCALRTVQTFRSGLFICADGVKGAELRVAYALEYYARGHCHEPGEESKDRARAWTALRGVLWEARP